MPQRTPQREPAGSNDIDNLANFVDGVDPKRYFDRQADDAWRNAARRWPVLAAVLGVDPDAGRRG
ncbi:hypothetical protein [Paraburkholderia caballeronis]|uniref:Cellulose biosynthesis protein BcsR n=1 Tax=Paraburkholderia caballeronis TaxID=416943 RepID=A0A1H7LET7_9BURK|nr:hypothetical protein [Paraburkholderia caballeronis]PXW28416.1 hypothetical protein C7403_102310 [Paraburkholderia caballeronis]PXX03782.1 hypothetical protein C7407_102310 [Paraburkholderia caballeronis]RAK04526.1 hypothetical protein C7409_102310 [Paraburkholderia caballeronis]TDV19431.1 hypothetical protein C7408_102176 [Paraburkholderia caballeronis]TDV22031.1 hypothetical protein C7406_101176 [Paraburkholderia caballeronis]